MIMGQYGVQKLSREAIKLGITRIISSTISSTLETEKQQKKQKKSKRKKSIKAQLRQFYNFISEYRSDISYSTEYCYLQAPILSVLHGEKEVNLCKGSQTGASEMMISLVLFFMMQEQKNIFYLLPTTLDSSDFSAARFNSIIEENAEIKDQFVYDNVGHKRCRKSNLYIRGSNSVSRLKSVPVSMLIIDERDEVAEEAAEIVYERLSGSKEKQVINISTPTLPDRGIWALTRRNSEYNFFIACKYCDEKQVLSLNNVDFEKRSYKCIKCKQLWTQKEKTKMIIDAVKKQAAGLAWQKVSNGPGLFFHIPQFLSPSVTAEEIVDKYENSDTEIKKQVFYNHKLGLPYVAEGTKLTRDIIDAKVDFFNTENFVKVAGIDISQSNLHYCIICSVCPGVGLVIENAFRVSWEKMSEELKRHDVSYVVIDANPERHSARNFLQGWGNGALALYPRGVKELYEISEKETRYVKISRTEVLDIITNRFRDDTILIQSACTSAGEYESLVQQLMNIVRIYREVRGSIEAAYVELGDDHYAHALAYAEIASRMATDIERESETTVLEGNFL